MKKTLLLLILLYAGIVAMAQYDTVPPYLRTKSLPDFTLVNTDSVAFNQSVLAKNKHTLVMLFNPECGHCQEQLSLLLATPDFLQQYQIVLTATETLEKIKTFYQKNKLGSYAQVFAGKDSKYFFGSFFRPKTIPVLAFYNAQKQLIYFSQGNVNKKLLTKILKGKAVQMQ
jgi:thiol-disulfide isomerase/thioredoxin